MFSKISLTIATLLILSGCVITPRIDFGQTLNFDYVPDQVPLSYADLLCCYSCKV